MADETNMGAQPQGAQDELPRVVPSFGEFQEDPAGYLSGAKTPAQAQGSQPVAEPGESDSILGAQAQGGAGAQPVAEGPQAGAQEEPAAGAAEGPQGGGEEKKPEDEEKPEGEGAPAGGALL